jgi:hypothetical protein
VAIYDAEDIDGGGPSEGDGVDVMVSLDCCGGGGFGFGGGSGFEGEGGFGGGGRGGRGGGGGFGTAGSNGMALTNSGGNAYTYGPGTWQIAPKGPIEKNWLIDLLDSLRKDQRRWDWEAEQRRRKEEAKYNNLGGSAEPPHCHEEQGESVEGPTTGSAGPPPEWIEPPTVPGGGVY